MSSKRLHISRAAANAKLLNSTLSFKKISIAIHIIVAYYVYSQMEVIAMSRTNVVLDDKLVKKCQKVTGIETKRSLIDYALHEVLRHENQKKLLELKGNIDWQGDLSAWRKGRHA